MTHEPPSREQTIDEIVVRLQPRFPSLAESTIRDAVTEAFDELKDARVRDFVEVLVEKQAKKHLKQIDGP